MHKPANRRYLSGFTGSSGLLVILPTRAYLCTDFRYLEQAAQQAPGWEMVQLDRPWTRTIKNLLQAVHGPVAFESDFLSFDHYQELIRDVTCDFAPSKGIVEALRCQKDEEELTCLRRAISLADAGASFLCSYLRPGLGEREVALELEFFLRRHGASGPAFPFIVASGPRSSLPHGEPTERKLAPGDLVTVDFGAVYEGYHSDLTRTFALGEPKGKARMMAELALAAQEKGIAAAGPGVPAAQVDAAAREVIARAGYGENFGHALGHGVGLEIHELPRLSSTSAEELLPGMVVTIEPGIYLPGFGGVRTEDVILITPNGREVLSRTPRQLFIL